LSSRSKG